MDFDLKQKNTISKKLLILSGVFVLVCAALTLSCDPGLPAVPVISVDTQTIDFGIVEAEVGTSSLSALLTNGGDAAVTISAAALSDTVNYTLQSPALPVTVNPGETAEVAATFAPTASGTLAATVSITVDGLADPVVINLTGSGNYRPTLKGGMGVYSGNPAVAGIYTEYATINSKLAYKRGNSGTVYYMYYIPAVVVPGFWVIDVSDSLTDSGTAMYRSAESVTSPDLVTTWNTSENFPVFNVDNVTGPVIAGDAFYANTNSTVYAYYLYDDKDGDAENGTTFQWYRCDSVDESNVGAAISGADSSSYLITNSDLGSWLKVEVMPKSASGISEGQPVKSAASPQITNAAILE